MKLERNRKRIVRLILISLIAVTTQASMALNTRLRVVSYNVLSSHLASPSHFTTFPPEHLKASNRLPVVLKKLEKELSEHQNVIFCLQEVSYDWCGALHAFFANRGYHLVSGLYGRKFNGYMGVAIAWPTATLQALDVDISRLSDNRVGGWPVGEETTTIMQLWNGAQSIVQQSLRKLGLVTGEDPSFDPWSYAEGRLNVLLTATLRDKASGLSFCIANYHMPCAFYAPAVMTIHSDLAVRHVQSIAAGAAQSEKSLPYIVAGDFNIKPTDSMYRLLTTGDMDASDPAFPPRKGEVEWRPLASPVRSAYATALGREPDFTNYARIKENDPFVDTLDYIFISPTWTVESVLELPNRQDSGGPFPNLDVDEPSDHVLIAATLGLSTNA